MQYGYASTVDYTWHIYKEGGQEHGIWPFNWTGYYSVDSNPNSKELTCKGDGNNECKIQGAERSCIENHINEQLDYVDSQILLNNLNGFYYCDFICQEDNELIYSSVSWTTDQNGATNIIVYNYSISGPQ
jgi:hypothetical protein